MPNFDQTGPMSEGPMTGRKMGKCSQNESEKPNFLGRGRQGKGRGLGRGKNCGSGNQNRFRGGR
jgi:hypothetical protein